MAGKPPAGAAKPAAGAAKPPVAAPPNAAPAAAGGADAKPGGNPVQEAAAMALKLIQAKPQQPAKKEEPELDVETADTRRDIDTAIFEPSAPRGTKPKPKMPPPKPPAKK